MKTRNSLVSNSSSSSYIVTFPNKFNVKKLKIGHTFKDGECEYDSRDCGISTPIIRKAVTKLIEEGKISTQDNFNIWAVAAVISDFVLFKFPDGPDYSDITYIQIDELKSKIERIESL